MRFPQIRHPLRALLALLSRPAVGGGRFCVSCKHKLGRFLTHNGGSAKSPELMLALEVIGSDVDHFECPWCGCNDRDRHLILYLTHGGLTERITESVVLHFAPERSVAAFIEQLSPARYLRTDIAPLESLDYRSSMEALPLRDESIDVVIANHVLEHVHDLSRAVTEIHRVLRTEGIAILQTPYSPVLARTFDDAGISQPSQRISAYGQEDHVRLFGSDIFLLISNFGFEAKVVEHQQALRNFDPHTYGVNPREPLMLFEKRRKN